MHCHYRNVFHCGLLSCKQEGSLIAECTVKVVGVSIMVNVIFRPTGEVQARISK